VRARRATRWGADPRLQPHDPGLESARAEVLAERAELERRVAARTAELERAQETLVHSEKMSAVGQLVAGVAHELNNPLTVVLGYAGILKACEADADKLRKLDSLLNAAEASKKIVQNLLPSRAAEGRKAR
jgi:C4-dicarboxylate-specific signal transduction histidine kinase